MIKEIFKRGIMGVTIAIIAIITMILGFLLMSGISEITIEISVVFKYIFIIMGASFIISASTIIFNLKEISLLLKVFIHCIVTFLILKVSIIYLGILEKSYLIQSIFISLYVIISIIYLVSVVTENKADVKFINEKLRILDKEYN